MKNVDNAIVLLAAYNGEPWLEEQIISIIKQKNVNVSIFISIDESSDNTMEVIQSISKKYANIHILRPAGKFGGAAANFFRLIKDVDFSLVNYICLSDQDDIWETNKISKAIKNLKNTEYSGYSSNVIAFWDSRKRQLINKAQPQTHWDYLFESSGPGCTFVLTQKLAMAIQEFVQNHPEKIKEIYLHDWFIYAFSRSKGYKWYIDSHPSMLYRQHSNNQVGTNIGIKAFIHRAKFVVSGKAIEQARLLATLCNLEQENFVKNWHKKNRIGMLYLACHANQCRRKTGEKVIFFFSCLLLALVGTKKA